MLAGGNVDANAHADLVANLNTAATFAPLTQLHDADVSGYLRHSHEQTLIACIEEGRRETEQEFYRVLDERVRRDWEVRKKKIFDELGKFNAGESARGGSNLRASALGRTVRGSGTGVSGIICSVKQLFVKHNCRLCHSPQLRSQCSTK